MRPWRILIIMIAACASPGPSDDAPTDGDPAGRAPVVIVMIGDGLGTGQLDTASHYRHGAAGRLFMQSLARRAEVRTGGLSGITDSSAAASVMATGHYTWNGRVALDRYDAPVETSLERARDLGWATGIVTTTSLVHATPASFTAHNGSRGDANGIAIEQIRRTRPTVMLGGGTAYYAAADVADLAADGYTVVTDRATLQDAVARGVPRLFGTFIGDQMTYVFDRPPDTAEPDLRDMTRAALRTLDKHPSGFFLMVEGGRIDHAGHANDLVRSVHETLAFDDTVALVASWARGRGNVTLIVTSDHECGGLELVTPHGPGAYPDVRWRWGAHTNARVPMFAEGPGTEPVDGGVLDHRWVYAMSRARIDGAPFVAPGREPIPDGEFGDLRHRAATQQVATGYGAGYNQLDALWLDATPSGLFVGVEGIFEWGNNAVEVWIDVDPGAGTGAPGLFGAIADDTGTADRLLAASRVTAPNAPGLGFGADLALVTLGGDDPHVEDVLDTSGLRGLRAPYGEPADLGWRRASVNFGAVRTRGAPLAPVPGQGLEAFIPWPELYPAGLPPGARVAVAVVLVNSDGGHTSNQALPSFPPGTANPGRAVTPLPGVVLYMLDANGDGAVDGDTPPTVVR